MLLKYSIWKLGHHYKLFVRRLRIKSLMWLGYRSNCWLTHDGSLQTRRMVNLDPRCSYNRPVPYISLTTVRQTSILAGIFAPPIITNNNCRNIHKDKLVGCEDGHFHAASGSIYYACSDSVVKRRAFWPPVSNFKNDVIHYGYISILNLKSETLTKLRFPTPDFEFNSHGIGIMTDPLNSNTIWIAAVNHKQSGSVVERFVHNLGSGVLEHVGTFGGELLHSPNDVMPVGKVVHNEPKAIF